MLNIIDNELTSLKPKLRQWQSAFCQTSSAWITPTVSNNGMTWAWLISKPGQKPFSTSKFTDSCRSNLLSVCIHRTGWVNKDSCIRFEGAHMPASVRAHPCGGRVIVYVCHRLNKGGKCVCVWHWLYPWIAVATFGDNVNVASFLSICVQKHTRVAQKHTRTTIVIHSTVRFNVSHPASTVGSCPNKGALHSSLCCSHPSLTPRFFLPSQTFQNPVRERRHRYRLWPNQDILTTNRQSASLMGNAQKSRIWNTCVKLRMH